MATLAALLLASCVSPQVVEKPAASVDFMRLKSVSYVVHFATDIELGSSRDYGMEVRPLFDAMLGNKLRSLGFDVVDARQAPEFSIDVEIKAAKSGSAAMRFFIGFGAGRAILRYDAVFLDAKGNRMALLEGGRSHTGMEFGESLAGKEQIQAIAVTQSVRQIEAFIRNQGSLP
ncbi:MAG: DUF4410 domain-containing protein [Gammaproteobacteria bacterium]